MNRSLFDKLLLLWGILLILFSGKTLHSISIEPVAVFLLSIISAALLPILLSSFQRIGIIGILLLCLLCPVCIPILPLILYDTIRTTPLFTRTALSWKTMLFPLGILLCLLTRLSSFSGLQLGLLGFTIVLAGCLGYRSIRLEQLEQQQRGQTDDATELQQRLRLQNRKLLVAQNDAILLSAMQERNRIAREIHDNVGHLLTRGLLQAGALEVCVSSEPTLQSVVQLKETLSDALTMTRTCVQDYHQNHISLESAVQECIQTMQVHQPIDLFYCISEQTPEPIKFCLIGILKESLTNAVKHSTGGIIQVVLQEHPGFYQLSVTNPVAESFPSKNPIQKGIGLETMRERAEQVGGTIRFLRRQYMDYASCSEQMFFRVFLVIPR